MTDKQFKPPQELLDLIAMHNGNKSSAAGDLKTTRRNLYYWLNGEREMSEMALELARMKLKQNSKRRMATAPAAISVMKQVRG